MDKYRKQLGITNMKYPLNIFDLCDRFKNVEIAAMPFNTKDLRGIVHIAESDNENHVILLNSNKSKPEQNYHGFHEFAHILTVDEPGVTINCFDKTKPNQNGYIEWLANEGAAELVMPYKEILPYIKKGIKYYDECSSCPIYALTSDMSSKYGVTSTVAQYRITSLSYEIWQYLNGTPIDRIKVLSHSEQQRQNIKIESLFDIENNMLNEMWLGNDRKPFFCYSKTYNSVFA